MKSHSLYQEDLKRILQTDGIKQLQGKRLLITGASGLIGVCLIDALMLYNQQGADIHIYATGRRKQSATSRLGECSGSLYLTMISETSVVVGDWDININPAI